MLEEESDDPHDLRHRGTERAAPDGAQVRQRETRPGYKARETAGAFGPDILREMGGLGLIAPELPEELGGLGAGSIYSGVIIEEIARADFNMGYINILASLNGQILARFGNDEIRRDWLPKLTAGELMHT